MCVCLAPRPLITRELRNSQVGLVGILLFVTLASSLSSSGASHFVRFIEPAKPVPLLEIGNHPDTRSERAEPTFLFFPYPHLALFVVSGRFSPSSLRISCWHADSELHRASSALLGRDAGERRNRAAPFSAPPPLYLYIFYFSFCFSDILCCCF